jgi:hypothetical protein
MVRLQNTLPFVYHIYMMIAEPRVRRLIYFVIYLGLIFAGAGSILKPPAAIQNILGGMAMIWFFGLLIVVGALLAFVAVLPGVWWLERSGLVGIGTGIAMYALTLLALGASFMVTILPIILILICALRWLDIKEYLLAPREG